MRCVSQRENSFSTKSGGSVDFAQFSQAVQRSVGQVVIGKARVVELLLVALLLSLIHISEPTRPY